MLHNLIDSRKPAKVRKNDACNSFMESMQFDTQWCVVEFKATQYISKNLCNGGTYCVQQHLNIPTPCGMALYLRRFRFPRGTLTMLLQALFAIVLWSMQTRHQYMVAVNAVVLQPKDLQKYLILF